MTVLQHLIRKIEHSNINLDAQEFTDVSQIIKKVRIPALEMNRDTAVALMQGGGGGGRNWGGVLRSGTVETLRVATLILREHPKRHIID